MQSLFSSPDKQSPLPSWQVIANLKLRSAGCHGRDTLECINELIEERNQLKSRLEEKSLSKSEKNDKASPMSPEHSESHGDDDWLWEFSVLAGMIMTDLGHAHEPSMEPGIDRLRDRIAVRIQNSFDSLNAKRLASKQSDSLPLEPEPATKPETGREAKYATQTKTLAADLNSREPMKDLRDGIASDTSDYWTKQAATALDRTKKASEIIQDDLGLNLVSPSPASNEEELIPTPDQSPKEIQGLTDFELLSLAADAAQIPLKQESDRGGRGTFNANGHMLTRRPAKQVWLPLWRDVDAFDLADALVLSWDDENGQTTVFGLGGIEVIEPHSAYLGVTATTADAKNATRRAIVKAAALMGSRIKTRRLENLS